MIAGIAEDVRQSVRAGTAAFAGVCRRTTRIGWFSATYSVPHLREALKQGFGRVNSPGI
jgi:hypothetical protein